MAVSKFVRGAVAIAFAAGIGVASSARSAELPCAHPQTPPMASAKIKIEAWKEPRLVEEFKKFGRQADYVFFDGPLYVPVQGKPEQPKIFKSWQIQKAFESPAQFILLDVSNSPGDGVYTLQLYRCATSQAWEPIWKNWMEVVDTKVGVERVR
jgi:hypothetical protein